MTAATLNRPLLALGAAAVVGLGSMAALGFSEEPLDPEVAEMIDPSQIPSVHNTFYTVPEGVVSWDVLGALEIQTTVLGPLRTVFETAYSDEIRALDGETAKVMGFIYPLEGKLEHEHFLLTAWPPSCPFCLPAGPAQLVDVLTAEPIAYSEGAVVLEGRFEILDGDPSGMYYRMHEARVVERRDDIRWTGVLPAEPLETDQAE